MIVFRQGCSYRQRLEAVFAARGWLPFRRFEFGTLDGVLGCVAADVGVTVLPRSAVERSACVADLVLEPLGLAPLMVDTLFVRRSDAYTGATLRAFAEMLGAADLANATPAAQPHGKLARRAAPITVSVRTELNTT